MIQIVCGSLLNACADVICQQVNCKGVMGAGLAKTIRANYPEIFKPYHDLCKNGKNNLGSVQYYRAPRYDIANLFAQDSYGTEKCHTVYDALEQCLKTVAKDYPDGKIAVPYGLGCGLAGGDWSMVYQILQTVFSEPYFHGTLLIYQI